MRLRSQSTHTRTGTRSSSSRNQLLPPRILSLEDLPGPAHALIASMLPDGRHPHKKLRLSEVSRAMLDFYGGTIKHMYLVWHKQHLVGPLASLLGRQRSLERIMVEYHEVLPQLASSIEQGCLRRVRELEMVLVLLEEDEDVELPSALNHIQSLRTAMRVPGALQSLEVLSIYFDERICAPTMELFAGALASGAAPSLRNLILELQYAELEDDAIEALATMFEARAQRPACRRLEVLKCDGRVAGNSQLMRALLPSVVELEFNFLDGDMDDLYQDNFASNGAPQLKKFKIVFLDEEGENIIVAPSVAMLESMPALESLVFDTSNQYSDQIAVLEPLILAMNRRMAFQRLQHLCLSCYCLENIEWDRVLRAIACVPQLTSLSLTESDLSPANMATFSTLFGQNAFPTLQSLRVSYDHLIGDQGVEVLVEGLLAHACWTRLKALDINSVKMGDKGMAALATAIREGRFERLEALNLGGNSDVTGRGVCALARAVRASGGQKLSSLLRILIDCDCLDIRETAVVELASALMNKCPRLKNMYLRCSYGRKALHNKLLEMVRAAGYEHRLKLEYWLWNSFDR